MSRGASRTSPPRRAEVAAVLSAEYSSTFRKVLFRSPPCVHPFAVAACRAWRPPYVGSARLPLSHRSRMSWFQIFVPSRCDAGRKHGFASPGSPNSFQNGKKQEIDGALILPADYLNPYDDATGRLNKTANMISIHWYTKSALSKRRILRSKLTRPFHRLFGVECFKRRKR